MERLSNQLLDHACNALQNEITEFIAKELGDTLSVLPDGSMDAVLAKTARWLQDEFQAKRKQAIIAQRASNDFSQQAGTLRMFTQMWSIFQLAWRQSKDTGSTSRAIAAGNKVARGLYNVSQTAELNLIIPHQFLVVVPAGAEGYSVGFDSPTPYIISPYWGLSQVWTWLSYAHEIGHHIYRNITGLEDELKVNVTLELWKQGIDRQHQQIWFNWLEEIFADLFGLLRIGLSFAHTQQLMLPYLPQPTSWPNVENRLLVADDLNHPMPYLRITNSLCVLEKLGTAADKLAPLGEVLKASNGGETPEKVYALVHGGAQDLPLKKIQEMANTVLDVLLETKLISLAKPSKPKERRSLKETFFDSGQGTYEKLLEDVYHKLHELLDREPSAEQFDDLNDRIIGSIMNERAAV